MIINFENLRKLPVRTASGAHLGRIEDLELEAGEHRIVKYLVARKKFFKEEARYLIAPEQIAEITAECVIVKDAAVNQETLSENKRPITLGNAASVNAEIEMQ
ncbi:MAG: PRC-barrel domain-containing protein [Parcubacteria group bacterium]